MKKKRSRKAPEPYREYGLMAPHRVDGKRFDHVYSIHTKKKADSYAKKAKKMTRSYRIKKMRGKGGRGWYHVHIGERGTGRKQKVRPQQRRRRKR